MRKYHNEIQISVSKHLYIYLTLLILLVPLRLVLALLTSAAVHELFHLISIKILKIDIHTVHVDVQGAVIETGPMTQWQEIICALAGPVSGLLLLLQYHRFPVVALCGGMHSVWNLLPIYPTDGGRVFRCVIQLIMPYRMGNIVMYITEIIMLSIISAFCIYGAVRYRLGILPIAFAGTMLLKSAKRK